MSKEQVPRMNEETITDLYNAISNALTEISSLMKSYGEQQHATNQLIAMQQDQIIKLKKRVEELESFIKMRLKDGPGT